ncbi:MAG: GyrI-like domain-containing protein [Pseudomonadales bacterium]|nr:GyrI-like domain-containing protein [Pseudomonadales bacterium]
MDYRIETLPPRLLVGVSLPMSRTRDRTQELWRSFGPRIREVGNRVSGDRLSMQVYAGDARQVLDPEALFLKWAAVEVADFGSVPAGLDTYELAGGLYAVFRHQGPATDISTFLHIYTEWLPSAPFDLDHREHFEVLPPGYDPMAASAEEFYWIPVTPR